MARTRRQLQSKMLLGTGSKVDLLTDDTVLGLNDVGQLFNVSVGTVRRWCKGGQLPSSHVDGHLVIYGADLKHYFHGQFH